MKRFPFKSLLALSLLLALVTFNACQKEADQLADKTPQNLSASDRGAGRLYGVTVYAPGHPSKLIEVDDATGQVLNAPGVQLFVQIDSGEPVLLNDLKGICWINGSLFVTTGASNTGSFNNLLLRVQNAATGQCSIVSTSNIGTVSDIDYDANTGIIYGLRGNTNTLVSITGGGLNVYTNLGPITNLGNGYVAKGLSIVRDNGGYHLVIASTAGSLSRARLSELPFAPGAAGLLTELDPGSELNGGHIGIGYIRNNNTMYFNRNNAVTVAGLNTTDWSNLLNPLTGTAFFGGAGYYYEDLTTINN